MNDYMSISMCNIVACACTSALHLLPHRWTPGLVEMELAARDLYVDELSLAVIPDADHAVLDLVCGKGGYVRSIARDLGEMLGCYGHVTTLRRIWSGVFEADTGVTLEALRDEAGCFCIAGICAEARGFGAKSKAMDIDDNVL